MTEEIKTIQKLVDTVTEFIVNYSFQVLGAVLVVILGFLAANWLGNLVFKAMQERKLDVTLSKFVVSVLRLLVLAFAVIIALGKFGITISPFLAAIGAVALGATLAFQGILANYGAGLTIILTRPFVVGNTISVAGVDGVVEEVKLACTVLTNEDGVKITIPNRHVVGQILQNSAANRIVEAAVGVSYDSDLEGAIGVVRQVLDGAEGVVREPAPQVGIEAFEDSAVKLAYRYWVPSTRYFQISFGVNLAVFKALTRAGIRIPFPRREVTMISRTDGSQPPPSTG
jgi:small conductance mechanosensitive channel